MYGVQALLKISSTSILFLLFINKIQTLLVSADPGFSGRCVFSADGDIITYEETNTEKIKILSPLQGDVIQSKDNKFNIKWEINDRLGTSCTRANIRKAYIKFYIKSKLTPKKINTQNEKQFNEFVNNITKYYFEKMINEFDGDRGVNIVSQIDEDLRNKTKYTDIEKFFEKKLKYNSNAKNRRYFLKLVIDSTQQQKEIVINDYVNNKNAWIHFTIYGTYSFQLQLIAIPSNEIVDSRKQVFTVLPNHAAFRHKPYDTYTTADFDLLKATCPPLLSSSLLRDDDNETPLVTITYVGNMKMDGQRVMWLEQMLNNKFKYRYLNFWNNINHGTYLKDALLERHVPLIYIPISVNDENKLWQQNKTYVTNLLLFYSDLKIKNVNEKYLQSQISSGSKLDWLNEVWSNMTDAFKETNIAVFPNWNEKSIQIYLRAARSAGVSQIVVEMSNWNVASLQNADIDTIIVPSMFMYNVVQQNLKLKNHRSYDLCHIPPSVGDMIEYASSENTSSSNTVDNNSNTMKRDFITIGVVSRLSYEKNIGFLLTVASTLKFQHNIKAKYVIIGDGPAISDLRHLARSLKVANDTTFLGYLRSAEIAQHVSKFDIFFNPTTHTETFCIANIEAMALGIPVVGFGLQSGSMEYIDDVAAIGIDLSLPLASSSSYISSKNIIMDKTLNILLHLIKDKHKRRRIGKRGKASVRRRYIKKYTMEMYERVYDLY
jgi:glycosyltransferase involved in cell wall biosynthesis